MKTSKQYTKFKFILFITCIAPLITSCAMGPDYERPDFVLPDTFREDFENKVEIVNLEWWDFYQEKQLSNLIRIAIKNNQSVGTALARMEEAAALLGITRADYFPSLDVQASIGRVEYDSKENKSREREGNLISTPVFWELDLWGKIRRSNEAARAELMASEYSYRASLISLVADVANTYFLLLDLENRLNIAKGTFESRRASTGIIKERFNKGYVAKIDLYQAMLQEADAEAAIQSFTRQINQTENALMVLLGVGSARLAKGKPLKEQAILPVVDTANPVALIDRRPDIGFAEESLHAQTARIGVAQAMRFPSLTLTGAFGVDSADITELSWNKDRFWSFSADVLGPILSMNRNTSRVDVQLARTKQLVYEYERTVLQAVREVNDSLIAVKTFRDEFNVRKKQVEAGKNAVKLSRARYDGGETSYLEVLDVERSLFRAELEASEALRQRFSSLITLYKALGGGWKVEKVSEKGA